MKRLLFLISYTLTALTVSAQPLAVPSKYSTIQAAINDATEGDTVLVDEGTYYENINFLGKAITVASHYILEPEDGSILEKTVIDGSQADDPENGSVVTMNSGEDSTSVLCGFTITGGSGNVVDWYTFNCLAGGGVCIYNSGGKIISNHIVGNHLVLNNPVGDWMTIGAGIAAMKSGIKNVIIEDNYVAKDSITTTEHSFAGGIYLGEGSEGRINRNTIAYNLVSSDLNAWGGGIAINNWQHDLDFPLYITNNMIYGNTTTSPTNSKGGGIHLQEQGNTETPTILYNNIIYDNHVDNLAGGIYILWGRKVWMYNNTLHNNSGRTHGNNLSIDFDCTVKMYNNILSSTIKNNADDVTIFDTNNTVYIYNNILKEYINSPDAEEINNTYMDPILDEVSFKPASNSPAIGRGVNSVEIDGVIHYAPERDIAENQRPGIADEYVDIGAYETEHAVLYNDNAFLAGLKFSTQNVEPNFDRENDEYTVSLPTCLSELNLTEAIPEDALATVQIDHAAECGGNTIIEVTSSDGSTMKTYTLGIVGVNDILIDELRCYPNPFSLATIIEFPGNDNIERVELINSEGRTIRIIEDIMESQIKINRDDLPAGTYFIQVFADKLYVNKVIIE